jgi:hypothetical protein
MAKKKARRSCRNDATFPVQSQENSTSSFYSPPFPQKPQNPIRALLSPEPEPRLLGITGEQASLMLTAMTYFLEHKYGADKPWDIVAAQDAEPDAHQRAEAYTFYGLWCLLDWVTHHVSPEELKELTDELFAFEFELAEKSPLPPRCTCSCHTNGTA